MAVAFARSILLGAGARLCGMVSTFGFLLQDGTAASFLASVFDMPLLFFCFVLIEACDAEVQK